MLDFTDVGNPWILGMIENDQEIQVNSMIEHINKCHPYGITKEQMESYFDMFDVDYPSLPDYLVDRIDTIEILEA